MMCDALNGWFNIWTKFRCEFKDEKGCCVITVHKPEDADKLFKIMLDITPIKCGHEPSIPAVEVARQRIEMMIDLIRNQKGAQNALLRKNHCNYSDT